MEFKQILQKLKYSNGFDRSSLIKEIILNIHNVDKPKLLEVLELLHDTADIKYQIKLISILTAYLHFNNLNRDVLIKWTPLYDTLSPILARGLPLKTTITLNFLTSLLYTGEDDGVSRSRTLTLYAQNLIRSSGCLTAMIHLFTNYMLPTDTWQALCRCLAEVCRGSEPNQNLCSHLVPLCVQRCLRGSTDVLPVLQSLLGNHKRNTHLFMETEGPLIFRKHYLRLEACLLLLNTVIQYAETESLRAMVKDSGVRENLQELLKINNNLKIVQWITIVLYYLDAKLKENDRCYNVTASNLNHSIPTDTNLNDTQILLQNIMKEVLSYPIRPKPLYNDSIKQIPKKPDLLPNMCDDLNFGDEEKKHYNKTIVQKKLSPPLNRKAFYNKRLSFSFLKDESSTLNQSVFNTNCNYNYSEVNQHLFDTKKLSQSKETRARIRSRDSFYTDFNPAFISTPKRLTPRMLSLTKNASSKRSFMELKNSSKIRDRTIIKKGANKNVSQERHSVKQRSMSSRLFDAINESCITIIRSVKNVFIGNKTSNVVKHDKVNNMNSDNNQDQSAYRSNSFTKYMRRREVELMRSNTNKELSSEINTLNSVKTCNTCDDTFLLRQKFSNDEQLKSTVKKLKLGINLYGCDFKRISKTMWPRDTYMTPNVLYNLYRKLLLK